MIETIKKIVIAFLILAGLAGCTPLIKFEQPARTGFVSLVNENSIGQTFQARYDGLEGAAVYLKPGTPGEGSLLLHLRTDPQATSDLATAQVPLQQVTATGFYRFPFPPVKDSTNRDYYLSIQMEGAGEVQVGTAAGDTYLNGALYENGTPREAQLTFRLIYNRQQALLGLFNEGLAWLKWLGIAIFLFILPGWALCRSLWSGWALLHWPEKLGLSCGLSLAIYPLLFVWTDLIHLHLGPLYAWLPPLAGLAAILWQNRSSIENWRRSPRRPRSLTSSPLLTIPWSDLSLLTILALIIAVRFWVIRGLDVPMWGDSYQHTMMAQLLVDNAGLFNSWLPYADLHSFTYHFGFHSLVAVFHWITHLPVPQSTLWTGQILNILAVFSLYPLAIRITRNHWAGIATVLLAGLLFSMPMFYVNWGRYTQLAGQAILPAVVLLSWSALETKTSPWGLISLNWIVLGGLAHTHYRVLIFAVVFLITFFALSIRPGRFFPLVKSYLWLSLGSIVLFLPWFIHTYAGKILSTFSTQLTTPPSQISAFTQEVGTIGNLFEYLPALAWIVLPLVIGWGIWRREKGIAFVSLWWFLIFLVSNPQWLNLPGAGAIKNFDLLIAAYFPVSLILGAALGWLGNLICAGTMDPQAVRSKFLPVWGSFVLAVIIVGSGLWGARQRLSDINPARHVLVTRPDLRAAAWLQRNTPQEARFLVNSFPAYGDTSVVGSDGGWWLPLLAHRQTTLPPLTYAAEQGPRPDYMQWVNRLTVEVRDRGIDDPEVLRLLHEWGVTHVYIGQRQGSVNYSGPKLEPEKLLASPHYRPVYHQDRVWVFEMLP